MNENSVKVQFKLNRVKISYHHHSLFLFMFVVMYL